MGPFERGPVTTTGGDDCGRPPTKPGEPITAFSSPSTLTPKLWNFFRKSPSRRIRPAAELQRFREVRGAHPVRPLEVGDRPRNAQQPVVGAGGQAHPRSEER